MKYIKVNHKFNVSSKKTEEEKVKWYIGVLTEKYSVEEVKTSINKIKKEAHDLVS